QEISWAARVRAGLGKTRSALTASLSGIFRGDPLDEKLLEQLHENLYRADLGVQATERLIAKVRQNLAGRPNVSWADVKGVLRDEILRIFSEVDASGYRPFVANPWVVLVVGVNGAGKTTSIGKLASHFKSQDKKVLLVAADTFRAAAID